MQIKKDTVLSLISTLSEVDKKSRRKNLTNEEAIANMADALRACRSILSILRKIK